MTQEEKASKYDSIIAEGDRVNRELSKLKSHNIGSGETPEVDAKINVLRGKLNQLEAELNKLF
jgi:hypothetical protein